MTNLTKIFWKWVAFEVSGNKKPFRRSWTASSADRIGRESERDGGNVRSADLVIARVRWQPQQWLQLRSPPPACAPSELRLACQLLLMQSGIVFVHNLFERRTGMPNPTFYVPNFNSQDYPHALLIASSFELLVFELSFTRSRCAKYVYKTVTINWNLLNI